MSKDPTVCKCRGDDLEIDACNNEAHHRPGFCAFCSINSHDTAYRNGYRCSPED